MCFAVQVLRTVPVRQTDNLAVKRLPVVVDLRQSQVPRGVQRTLRVVGKSHARSRPCGVLVAESLHHLHGLASIFVTGHILGAVMPVLPHAVQVHVVVGDRIGTRVRAEWEVVARDSEGSARRV
jgi:hypothetical protein